jgi:hypothetical protein
LGILVPTTGTGITPFTGILDPLKANGATVTETPIAGLFTAASPNLSTFLGLAGTFTPTDNFSNADAFNPNITGFDVFKVTLSNVTLNDNAGPISPLLAFQHVAGDVLPIGTDVVGFFNEATGPHPGDLIGTAPSGDLVVTTPFAVPGPVAGAGWPGIVFASLGLAWP